MIVPRLMKLALPESVSLVSWPIVIDVVVGSILTTAKLARRFVKPEDANTPVGVVEVVVSGPVLTMPPATLPATNRALPDSGVELDPDLPAANRTPATL